MVVFPTLNLIPWSASAFLSVDQGLRTAAVAAEGGVIFLRADFSFSSDRGTILCLRSLFKRLSGGADMPVAMWGISKEVEVAMFVYFLESQNEKIGERSYHPFRACTFIWTQKER
jgi:hypothetical protein